MGIVNHNSKVTDNNTESEPAVQKTHKIVRVNQLDMNELKRSTSQLLIERS